MYVIMLYLGYIKVRALLQMVKVYIDVGPHRGMNRLPHEASLAYCIVITNTSCVAGYPVDTPIPSEYKMPLLKVNVIHRLLMSSLKKYEQRNNDFCSYREWIGSQENRMIQCIYAFVQKVVTERNK